MNGFELVQTLIGKVLIQVSVYLIAFVNTHHRQFSSPNRAKKAQMFAV